MGANQGDLAANEEEDDGARGRASSSSSFEAHVESQNLDVESQDVRTTVVLQVSEMNVRLRDDEIVCRHDASFNQVLCDVTLTASRDASSRKT